MSKHSNPTIWPAVEEQKPAHSAGWSFELIGSDWVDGRVRPRETPGRHAKPFAAHHPARLVTYNAQGTVTPLTPATHVLDVAA